MRLPSLRMELAPLTASPDAEFERIPELVFDQTLGWWRKFQAGPSVIS